MIEIRVTAPKIHVKLDVASDWLTNEVYIYHTYYRDGISFDTQYIAIHERAIDKLIEQLQFHKAELQRQTDEYNRDQTTMPILPA